LALAVADEVWMFENSVYSVISPEGCASILWKDSTKAPEAAECLKMTAKDLFDLGIIERVLREPGAEDKKMFESLKLLICRTFEKNLSIPVDDLTITRYNRFKKFGN
jgi:acetyl-CoA carboxylase carboxyl transferase subunit alpha